MPNNSRSKQNAQQSSHKWVNSIWYGQSNLSYLLLPLSGLFSIASIVRKYKQSLKKNQYSVPTIVVGNITVGGTGKTPMVISLIQELEKLGYRPGVASRGYGGNITEPTLVDDNQTPLQVGDEPLLVYQKTKGTVVVGKSRIGVIDTLIQKHHCDVIICDDGLQDYRFRHDVEIVMVDGERIFGNKFLLPAGPLRESMSRLHKADFIVATTKPLPAISADCMKFQLKECVQLNNNACREQLSDWKGRLVHAIAGIGNPDRFFKGLSSLGLNVIQHPYPDHAMYKVDDFDFSDENPILMTEKDAVKCRQFELNNAWYIPMQTELPEDFIPRLHTKLRNFDG